MVEEDGVHLTARLAKDRSSQRGMEYISTEGKNQIVNSVLAPPPPWLSVAFEGRFAESPSQSTLTSVHPWGRSDSDC